MVNNWEKQKQTMEEDMWAAQDAAAKYVDGDMDEQPTQEERRSITKNVLALQGIADKRLLRSPERFLTTQTRTKSRPEDQRRSKTSWTQGSTWASLTPAQPDTEEQSSASDTSWKDQWQWHKRWGDPTFPFGSKGSTLPEPSRAAAEAANLRQHVARQSERYE